MDRLCFPDVPLEVYSFSNLHLHIVFQFLSLHWVKLFLMNLAKAQCQAGDNLLPRAYYSPGNRLKTIAVILAGVQLLLSYNTCRGIHFLPQNSCSWLLHLTGKIVLTRSKSQGRLLLTGEAHFHRCSKLNLDFDTCQGIYTLSHIHCCQVAENSTK